MTGLKQDLGCSAEELERIREERALAAESPVNANRNCAPTCASASKSADMNEELIEAGAAESAKHAGPANGRLPGYAGVHGHLR